MQISKITEATGKILVYIKMYNYKLCRKGLLERGMSVGRFFGDFKKMENEFLSKITNPTENKSFNEMLFDINQQKSNEVKIEVLRLKVELGNLFKTIQSQKRELQKSVDEFNYLRWSRCIEDSSLIFKKEFSEEFNRLYDYLYYNERKFEESMQKIADGNRKLISDIMVHLMKGDMENDFTTQNKADASYIELEITSNSSKNEDSGIDISFGDPSVETEMNPGQRKKIKYEVVDEIGAVSVEEFEANIIEGFQSQM